MNRTERRKLQRKTKKETNKLSEAVNKLSPTQLKLIDILAEQKCDKLLDEYKKLVTESALKAMRQHHISFERGRNILEDTEKIIQEEVKNEYKSNC